MTALAPKRPTEIKRYVLDYARELGGDPIIAFQFEVTAGAVVVQTAEQLGPFAIVALIGSGVDGQTSALELQMTTDGGQLIIRDFTLLTANALSAAGSLPSSTTKGQLVNMAFEEASLAGYEFDATPAEQASALQRLDVMMAIMASPGENLDIGYNFPTAIGGSAMTDMSGAPDMAVDYLICRLALSIAPAIGKTMSADSRRRMAESYRAVRATFARIPISRLPRSTIRGAGAKPWSTWWPFVGSLRGQFIAPINELGIEGGGVIGDQNGDILGG